MSVAQLLLVEDDAAIRGALIRALTERGHAVTSMPSAMDALQHVLDSPPDLILLDLGLPGLGGYEALRMMRAVSSVPVVVVTARDNEAEIIRVLVQNQDELTHGAVGTNAFDHADFGGQGQGHRCVIYTIGRNLAGVKAR